MKMLTAAIAGLVIALTAQAAQAYVVRVVTTVPINTVTSPPDTSQLGEAVASAVSDVLRHVIVFTPTFVRIEDAVIIGTQLYLVVLLADADGEALLHTAQTSPSGPEAPDDDLTDEILVPEPPTI